MRIFTTLAIAAWFLLIVATGVLAQDDAAAPEGSTRAADIEKISGEPAAEFITPTTYIFSAQSGVALEDMSSGTTQLLGPGGDNENSALAQIGFLYRYDNVFFTSFGINANGFLKLGGASISASNINTINSTPNAPKIMPYWDDLCIGNSGKVHYKLVGSPGNQRLVIEWKNMKITKGNSCDGTGNGTFQMWLSDRTGVIQFVYGDGMVTAATPNGGYSIGIQSGAASNFASITTVDNSVSYTVANNGQITAIQSGTSYLLTPNMPPAPSGLSATNVTQTSVTINWTDNAFSETAYLVRRTTDGINYFFVGNTLPANSTSFTENGLEPGVQYTYVVNALSEGAFSADASVIVTTIPPRNISSTGIGGPWSSPSTWVGGSIPDTNDNVTIVSGATVTIDTANALAGDVTIGTGGGSPSTLQFGESGAFALKVTRNVTIGATDFFKTGSGNANQHVLTLSGNIINNGTLDFSTNNNQAGAGIVFNGASTNTFGGSGPVTDVRTITINKGTSSANVLELTLANFTVQGSTTDGPGSAYLFLLNGTFKISGTFAGSHRTFASAAYQIVITAGLWLNNPNYTVTPQSATVGFFGLFRLSAGSYNVGTGTGHMAYYRTGSKITVEGGSLTVTGGLQGGGVSTFAITGGKITTCTWGLSAAGTACFDFGTAGGGQSIAMLGGDMVVQNPPGFGGIYLNRTPNTQMGATVLHFGNALTAGAGVFGATGYIPNIHIDTTGGNHRFLFTNGGSSNDENWVGNITLDAGGTVEFSSEPLNLRGERFINNGVFKSTSSSGKVSIAANQADFEYTGSGTMTGLIAYLKVNRNLVFGTNVGNVRVRNIDMLPGNIVNASKLTIGNNDPEENKITFSSTFGTFDSAPVFDIGPGWQTIEYYGARTTGPEINPARTLNILKFDNPGVLTIAGGDITITNGFGVAQGEIFTGPHKLILTSDIGRPSGFASSPSVFGYVNGTIKFRIPHTGTYVFAMGHNGYSPLKAQVTAVGTNPSWLTVSNFDTSLPGLFPFQSVSRYWRVAEEGDITATLSFSYADSDVHGNENSYTVWRSSGGGTPAAISGSTVNTATNTATTPADLTSFDFDWGIGARLDGPVSISGTVMTSGGQPLRNAQVIISGGNLPAPVTFITGTFGTYLFEGLEAGQTYNLNVSVKRYRFPVGGQQVTPLDDVTGVNFIANPQE
jgi:hypothetical protein